MIFSQQYDKLNIIKNKKRSNMRILRTIFNFSSKYHNDAVRYERHGKLSRILTLIFAPIVIALGIGCIYFARTMDANPLLKVLAIFVAFFVSCSFVGRIGVYSVCGFIFFIWGSLESFENRRQIRKQKKLAKKLEAQQKAQETQTLETDKVDQTDNTTQNLTTNDSTTTISSPSEETSQNTPDSTTTQEEAKPKKVSKWLDLFVGIYCLALAVVGFFWSLVLLLNGATL